MKQKFDWLLTGCHAISEVAVAYYPHYAHNYSAVRAFQQSIKEHAALLDALTAEGYTLKTRHLTPLQIAIIVRYWGFPDYVEDMVEKDPYLGVPKKYKKK